MRDDRNHVALLQPRQDLGSVLEHQQVRKLDQQIAALVDRVLPRIRDRVLNILVAQMKIAARVEPWRPAQPLIEVGDPLTDQVHVELIVEIRVWRSHQVGGAVFEGHAGHRERIFERFRAVVHAPQDMAVNVDQAPF